MGEAGYEVLGGPCSGLARRVFLARELCTSTVNLTAGHRKVDHTICKYQPIRVRKAQVAPPA